MSEIEEEEADQQEYMDIKFLVFFSRHMSNTVMIQTLDMQFKPR